MAARAPAEEIPGGAARRCAPPLPSRCASARLSCDRADTSPPTGSHVRSAEPPTCTWVWCGRTRPAVCNLVRDAGAGAVGGDVGARAGPPERALVGVLAEAAALNVGGQQDLAGVAVVVADGA